MKQSRPVYDEDLVTFGGGVLGKGKADLLVGSVVHAVEALAVKKSTSVSTTEDL